MGARCNIGEFETSTSSSRMRSYGMSASRIDVAPGPVVGVAGVSVAVIGDGSIVIDTVPVAEPPKPSLIVYVNESLPKYSATGVYVQPVVSHDTVPCAPFVFA